MASTLSTDSAVASGVVRNAGRVLTTRAQHESGERVCVDLSFGLVEAGAR